jgi:hypothetical protein
VPASLDLAQVLRVHALDAVCDLIECLATIGACRSALAMAYKLLDSAQHRWRRFNGHELVPDVLAGTKYKDGIPVTEEENGDNEMTDEKVAA